jgi:hypothetical protein
MDDELARSAWAYKPLKGRQAREWKINQIRLGGNRAALTIISETQEFWFSEVYSKRDQIAAIARAITRAKEVRSRD